MTRSTLIAAAILFSALAVQAAPADVEPRAVVGRVADRIEAVYFDPQIAARIAGELRDEAAAGRFDRLRDPSELAAVLTDRLRPEDGHFGVAFTPPAPAAAAASGTTAARSPAGDAGAVLRENHGFRRVEVLPGNVGLIDLTLLGHFEADEPVAESARGVADAALAMVARASALILDLRDCRGGSPAMVGYLIGHFVAEDADIYNTFKSRGPDQSERPSVPIAATRRLDLPLYVVVSGRTGSGAESVAYTLQAARRATVVGERTAGGANPGDLIDVGDGLSVFVSIASPVNPITKKNWEADGVVPDRAVAAAEAETAAYELALEAVLERSPAGLAADEARWALEASHAARSATPIDAQSRARIAGSYGTRTIRDDGEALIYVLDRRPPKRLIPLGGDLFTLEGSPYTRVELEHSADGAIAALVLRQVYGAVARYPRSPK